MTSKEELKELLYYANLNFERENERKTEFSNKIEQMGVAENEESFKIVEKDLDLLEEYRKIEEELGIDLITLFKALKNGIYLKFGSEKITGVYYEHRAILPRHFDKDYKGYFIDLQLELSINFNFYFKDYGKTWALTREELE